MRSIGNKVRRDVKAAMKLWLPWWVILSLLTVCIPLFVVLDHYGKLAVGPPMLTCFGAFVLLIYLKRSIRQQPLFWVIIGVLAAVHAMLIWYIPWTSDWVPAAFIAGICSIDFYVMLWVLAALEVWLADAPTTKE